MYTAFLVCKGQSKEKRQVKVVVSMIGKAFKIHLSPFEML
jgi:hypothetical protein